MALPNIERLQNEILEKNVKVPPNDLNYAFENGIYWYNSGIANVPACQYGTVFIFKAPADSNSHWWTQQIAVGTDNKIYIRTSLNKETWTDWNAIG